MPLVENVGPWKIRKTGHRQRLCCHYFKSSHRVSWYNGCTLDMNSGGTWFLSRLKYRRFLLYSSWFSSQFLQAVRAVFSIRLRPSHFKYVDPEEYHLLGCDAVQSVEFQPTFQRNISPPSSRSKKLFQQEPANKQVASRIF
jgi:hypothetical protein